MTPYRILFFVLILLQTSLFAQELKHTVTPAAHRVDEYLPLLKNKAVAVFANHTSMINNTHLVDTLMSKGINIKKIFAPEHGFRGTADAGSKIDNATDPKTGIPVLSLYGKKIRPSDEDLANIDVLVFDIQDVGVRFYTYISSLEEYMVSAIRNNKPLVVLDRPNPNGFYIDGPVLDPKFKSFVGMQQVPVVYGMTMGEYAKMLCGENLFDSTTKAKRKQKNWNKLTVIKNANYDHNSLYELPVKPSPNLPDDQSIYLYPTTCFIEGTVLSEGRGTPKPFKVFGHPSLPKNMYSFTPKSIEGATNPKLKDQKCYGWDLSSLSLKDLNKQIRLNYIIDAYNLFPKKQEFFLANKFFNKLAGNDILMQQIKDGKSEDEIRKSWKPGLDKFKKTRKKYLLYKDFE